MKIQSLYFYIIDLILLNLCIGQKEGQFIETKKETINRDRDHRKILVEFRPVRKETNFLFDSDIKNCMFVK